MNLQLLMLMEMCCYLPRLSMPSCNVRYQGKTPCLCYYIEYSTRRYQQNFLTLLMALAHYSHK